MRRRRAERLRLASQENAKQSANGARRRPRPRIQVQVSSLFAADKGDAGGSVKHPPMSHTEQDSAGNSSPQYSAYDHARHNQQGQPHEPQSPVRSTQRPHTAPAGRKAGQVPDFRALHTAWARRLANAKAAVHRGLTMPKVCA